MDISIRSSSSAKLTRPILRKFSHLKKRDWRDNTKMSLRTGSGKQNWLKSSSLWIPSQAQFRNEWPSLTCARGSRGAWVVHEHNSVLQPEASKEPPHVLKSFPLDESLVGKCRWSSRIKKRFSHLQCDSGQVCLWKVEKCPVKTLCKRLKT